MTTGEFHDAHQSAFLIAYVEPTSAKLPGVHVLAAQERPNPIGQPNLTASSGPNLSKVSEDGGRERVSANRDHVRDNFVATGLLFNPCDPEQAVLHLLSHDHPVRRD